MPFTMAQEGNMASIKRLSGKGEVCRHLESMGLVPGMRISGFRT